MNRVGIIGGGFGGIAAAIRMRARGNDVVLCERLESLGGRAQVFKKNNYIIKLNDKCWDRLQSMAFETYVPESEASKSGAGY